MNPHVQVDGLLIAGIECSHRVSSPEQHRSGLSDPVAEGEALPGHPCSVDHRRMITERGNAEGHKVITDKLSGAGGERDEIVRDEKWDQPCNAYGGQHVVVAKKLDELTARVRDASREISCQTQVFSLPQVPYTGIAGRGALSNRRRGVHGMIVDDQ